MKKFLQFLEIEDIDLEGFLCCLVGAGFIAVMVIILWIMAICQG